MRLRPLSFRLAVVLTQLGFATLAGVSLPAHAKDEPPPAWVTSLAAARPVSLSGAAGQWLPWDNQYDRTRGTFTRGGITPAQGQTWDTQMRAITEFLKQTPVLAKTPQGFFPEFSGHIAMLNVGGFEDRPQQAPLTGGVTLYVWPARDIRMNAKGVPEAHGETPSFRIELNYVYPPRGGTWMQDAKGEFGPLEQQGTFAGFPLLGNSLVITRNGRLPFVPVSQQRALQAFIAFNKKSSTGFEATLATQRRKAYEDFISPEGKAKRRARIEADVKKAHPSMAEQVRRKDEAMDRRKEQDLKADAEKASPLSGAVAEAQKKLSAMTETQRNAPAWLRPSRGVQFLDIVDAGTAGASPLMAFDPNYFDPKQPRETLRIASVRELHNISERAARGSFPQTLYLQLLQQTDWKAFAERFLK
ncbi:MAG: hypothetical protein GC149_15095 [Gammaproteobacteria bacterium]|nr:hypothetical protein [Gammaproteobacteria bacterium]